MPDLHDDMDVAYTNTPEQRAAALAVVTKFADTASLPELLAILELAD